MNKVEHFNEPHKSNVIREHLRLNRFSQTPFELSSDKGSPIKQARDLCTRMNKQFKQYYHIILVHTKNMDGASIYEVWRKPLGEYYE